MRLKRESQVSALSARLDAIQNRLPSGDFEIRFMLHSEKAALLRVVQLLQKGIPAADMPPALIDMCSQGVNAAIERKQSGMDSANVGNLPDENRDLYSLAHMFAHHREQFQMRPADRRALALAVYGEPACP